MHGQHYNTIHKENRDAAINFGYRDEGIACYVYEPIVTVDEAHKSAHYMPPKVPEVGPLFPLFSGYKQEVNDHFLTMSDGEYQEVLRANVGYVGTGIECFVAASNNPIAGAVMVPLYSLWREPMRSVAWDW
ncbi:hypothetical protein QTI33_07500 [Variovorax sp. J22P271]|uniref:hypothetical protein n=1 Tax=Variovorax davisae TaxID=3053515 RepID=UPI002575F0EA|nr:hypothetical protein [Variovorax sp. J22P271]MDM0031989.1 hypothetical protein [Variovorax sp. J22P271]